MESRHRRGLDVLDMMCVTVPGIGNRPSHFGYAGNYGMTTAEFAFIRPKCRRWWIELRRRKRYVPLPAITTDTLIAMWQECEEKYALAPREIRMTRRTLEGVKIPMLPMLPTKAPNAIFGLPVIEDPTLQLGEIRLVSPRYTSRVFVNVPESVEILSQLDHLLSQAER